MMKILFSVALFGIIAPCMAVEIEDGWVHSVDTAAEAPADFGSTVSIQHPNGNGVLKIRTYRAPQPVTIEQLRNMTNVDLSMPLTWQSWGDYKGYQYDYAEGDLFFRQWWLVNDRSMIFIVYEGQQQSSRVEIEEINSVVRSITVIAK
jgi:hypothetical protein